jgi:hypothetical protein
VADELKVLRSVSKPALRKGRSYVVKTMELDRALMDAGISTHVDLIYWEPEGTSSIMQCLFWPANANVSYDRFYARAGFVASQEKSAAMEAWRSSGLPALIDWAQWICNLSNGATIRSLEPIFEAYWKSNALTISRHPRSN